MLALRRSHRVALVAIQLVSLASPAARADADAPGPTGPGSVAEQAFRNGREAMKRGDYDAAHNEFERSYALDQTPGTLLNLAVCEAKLAHLVAASTHLREFLAKPDVGEGRRALAERHLADVEARTPHVVIRWRADESRGSVFVDGTELDSTRLGAPVPLDAGKHVIVFRLQAWKDREVPITLREGESAIVVSPPAEAAEAPMPTPSRSVSPPRGREERGASTQRTAGYVMGAAGIAALVTSGITFALALGEKATFDEHCSRTAPDGARACDDADGVNAGERAIRLANVSTVALAVGVVSLGAGGYLVLTGGQGTQPGRAARGGAGVGAAWHVDF
jgi:hypothetical protein